MISRTRRTFKAPYGYTLVEILIAIAIISIMVAIVVGTFAFNRKFDTLKAETNRLTAVLRNARNRDFNGVVANDGNQLMYPAGGYGLFIDTDYNVCTGNSRVSCIDNGDCAEFSPNTCGGASGNTHYVIFADFDADGIWTGNKVDDDEFIEEFQVTKDYKIEFGTTEAVVLFRNHTVSITGCSTCPVTSGQYALKVNHTNPPDCSNVRNKEGEIVVDLDVVNFFEDVVDC